MRSTLYAVVAASLAMFATSGIVALATAAPSQPAHSQLARAEAELVAHLDTLIETRFAEMKERLAINLP